CARTAHRRARCRTCRHGCRWWSWPACADPALPRATHAPGPDCLLTASGCSEKTQVTNLIMYSSPTGPRTTWPLRIRPLACDEAAVPGQQRTRRDQPMRAQHSWQPPVAGLPPALRRVVPRKGKLAQERVGQAVAGHADARVHGDDTVGAGDHRVEVKLGDLRQLVGEPRHPEQGV